MRAKGLTEGNTAHRYGRIGFRVWRRKAAGFTAGLLLAGLGLLLCMPVLFLLSGSFTGAYEMREQILPAMQETEDFVSWSWIIAYPDFSNYGKVLFYSPQFFVLFWNSAGLVLGILAGQLLIAVPAAWCFAVFPFPMRKLLFSVYVVLMLMPFQVTMLSNYLVLDGLGLMNTPAAVVLPAVFSTFPVFLIYRGFTGIPVSLLEAARIDGGGEWHLFLRIGIPLGRSGILSALVLGFLEYWNLMEQPLAFLEDKSLWPLSLYLPEIGLEQAGFAMAASVITLMPAGLVFRLGQDYLEQGISASGLKE